MCLPSSLLSSPHCKQTFQQLILHEENLHHGTYPERFSEKVETFSLKGKPLQPQCQVWAGRWAVQPEYLKTLSCLPLHSPFQNGRMAVPSEHGSLPPVLQVAAPAAACIGSACQPQSLVRSPECEELSWQQLSPCRIFPIVTVSSAQGNNLQ